MAYADYMHPKAVHVHIDIETTGLNARTGCIAQVGLVVIDAANRYTPLTVAQYTTGLVGLKEFYGENALVDERTWREFWLNRDKVSEMAFKSVMYPVSEHTPYMEMLTSINRLIPDYTDTRPVFVWANSPEFDLTFIRDDMEKASAVSGTKLVFKPEYWQHRDVRTIRDLHEYAVGIPFGVELYAAKFDGVALKHTAVCDALTQAAYVSTIIGALVHGAQHG